MIFGRTLHRYEHIQLLQANQALEGGVGKVGLVSDQSLPLTKMGRNFTTDSSGRSATTAPHSSEIPISVHLHKVFPMGWMVFLQPRVRAAQAPSASLATFLPDSAHCTFGPRSSLFRPVAVDVPTQGQARRQVCFSVKTQARCLCPEFSQDVTPTWSISTKNTNPGHTHILRATIGPQMSYGITQLGKHFFFSRSISEAVKALSKRPRALGSVTCASRCGGMW